MQFREAQLDNGLKIIAEVNPSAATLATGFFARTGSRDETPNVAGVSHFLEHMVFKGTARRSAAAVNLAFDEMGANYNAFTSEENTVYFASVLPEFQASCLDLLCDILRPSLRQEDFDGGVYFRDGSGRYAGLFRQAIFADERNAGGRWEFGLRRDGRPGEADVCVLAAAGGQPSS